VNRNRVGLISLCAALALVALAIASVRGRRGAPDQAGPRFGATPARSAPGERAYRFAVHPLHNPAMLMRAYGPLIERLNERVREASFVLEASRDYASFEEKYHRGEPEFLLPNPWQTLEAERFGYRVIAMAGEPRDFIGLFVVRKDVEVNSPTDLKGKAVSYPSATALAACIMPQYFLYEHGVDVTKDIDNRYVGSQESAIMNVYLRLTAAGATWPTPWRAFLREHPAKAADLKVIWETPPLVNNSVMARADVPAPIVDDVRGALVALEGDDQGKAILAGMETARFLPATEADYEIVRAYIANFEAKVRPVEGRP
jgi:phosphonate transport system substrate-binding protein